MHGETRRPTAERLRISQGHEEEPRTIQALVSVMHSCVLPVYTSNFYFTREIELAFVIHNQKSLTFWQI